MGLPGACRFVRCEWRRVLGRHRKPRERALALGGLEEAKEDGVESTNGHLVEETLQQGRQVLRDELKAKTVKSISKRGPKGTNSKGGTARARAATRA